MSEFKFADRYAEAGIAPGAAIITSREAPAGRIAKRLTANQAYDLVGTYFGHSDIDLGWFRDQFAKEDASFSLVNNQRECVVLAAAILGAKVASRDEHTIMALVTASVVGKRPVVEAPWLLSDAKAAFMESAVAARKLTAIETEAKVSSIAKLEEEISSLPNDWPKLQAVIAKVRSESQDAAKSLAAQLSTAVEALVDQVKCGREETQMLWWLFGESSITLGRHFGTFSAGQAAIFAGFELANLASYSWLGPVAGPVMLERVLGLAGKENATSRSLAATIDSISPTDIQRLQTNRKGRSSQIFPVMTAIDKANEIGVGSWHSAFQKATGLNATIEFDPIELATQVYNEGLLGQFP